MDEQDPVLTREEVCDLLYIRKNLFYQMLRDGSLPRGIRQGKRNVWLRSSIVRAIKSLRDKAERNVVWREPDRLKSTGCCQKSAEPVQQGSGR